MMFLILWSIKRNFVFKYFIIFFERHVTPFSIDKEIKIIVWLEDLPFTKKYFNFCLRFVIQKTKNL